MPTCSPRCVEPLFFLVRRNLTIRYTRILERRCSLSKKITKSKPLHLPFFSCTRFLLSPFPFLSPTNSFPLFLCLPFAFLFCSFSFLFVFLFSSSYFSSHFSLGISPPIWSIIDSMGQRGEISSPLSQAKCVAISFPFLFFYFIIPLYDIITYMAQCEPWNSYHPCGSM